MIGALPPLSGCRYSRDSKPPTPTASRGSWAILRLDVESDAGVDAGEGPDPGEAMGSEPKVRPAIHATKHNPA
jgi:hypothetical protein